MTFRTESYLTPLGKNGERVVSKIALDDSGRSLLSKLPLRLDLGNHSPTGFAWGYLGSGPHQLALAMLADATGDDQLALKLAHFLKEDLICRIDGDCAFSVSAERVREWAAHRYLELHEP